MVPTAITSRVPQLLDDVRVEFEALAQETAVVRLHRDEYEAKLNAQVQEMQAFHNVLAELHQKHMRMRQKYEQEIARLRRELSSRGIVLHDSPSLAADTATDDWVVAYNPSLDRATVPSVHLLHSMKHDSVVCSVRFSPPDGTFLATGSNRSTRLFRSATGELVCELVDTLPTLDTSNPPDQYIRALSFGPDGTTLATGAEDRIIRIWSLHKLIEYGPSKEITSSLKPSLKLTGHEQDIYALDHMPLEGGELGLVSGSGDGTARIWNLNSGECLHVLRPPVEELTSKEIGITSVTATKDGHLVATGSRDRFVRVWDVKSGTCISKLDGHHDAVYSVVFFDDIHGQSIVSGSLDKTMRFWITSEPTVEGSSIHYDCHRVFVGHKDFVLSVAAAQLGHGFEEGGLAAGNDPTESNVNTLHQQPRWVMSASKDRSIIFWNPLTGESQFCLQGHKNSGKCC